MGYYLFWVFKLQCDAGVDVSERSALKIVTHYEDAILYNVLPGLFTTYTFIDM